MRRSTIHIHGWLLLLPAMVLLATFTYYPTVGTAVQSFFATARAGRPPVFVGLGNYQSMIEDPVFWQALWNNFIYALGTVPASIALALLMAVWVNGKIRGRALVRMAYFTPTVLPMIAVANIWMFFYTPDYGLINQIAGLFGWSGHNWLGDPNTVLGSLM
ncbi:MAG: carbohydrate ABC transporter permease, partial [Burkholderiales bacterium]